MAILGNNILIYRNGTAIAGTVSNEIQSGAELIEISSPTSGQWKEYIAGRKNWSINVIKAMAYIVLTQNFHPSCCIAIIISTMFMKK